MRLRPCCGGRYAIKRWARVAYRNAPTLKVKCRYELEREKTLSTKGAGHRRFWLSRSWNQRRFTENPPGKVIERAAVKMLPLTEQPPAPRFPARRRNFIPPPAGMR